MKIYLKEYFLILIKFEKNKTGDSVRNCEEEEKKLLCILSCKRSVSLKRNKVYTIG